MQYLVKIGDRYYYNRRVPQTLSNLIGKSLFRVSLKTDSKKLAERKCAKLNAEIEQYWQSLLQTGELHSESRFNKAVNLAKLIGFSYVPIDELSQKSVSEIVNRVKAIEGFEGNTKRGEAILGTAPQPEMILSEALETFWAISKNRTINKSDQQIRKWRNPRIKAIRNAIHVIGNISIENLNKSHIIKFRDWWIDRMENEGIKPSTANKDLIHLKNIVQTVADHFQLETDFQRIFRKITLTENKEQERKPFEAEYIQHVLLKPDSLKGLNSEAKNLVLALINTGARLSELTGLNEEDIKLDEEIPHIIIRPNDNRNLKTHYSKRTIPLIGCSLEAFKKYPNGFPRYKKKTDNLSNLVNKYFRDNDLFPSEKHFLYSLRHSFQDRLTRANVNDRMQAELMGHKFQRPLYGDGPTLAQKHKCLKDISF